MHLNGFGNEITSNGAKSLVPQVYPASLKKALARLKYQSDPHNMLRANHNIAPKVWGAHEPTGGGNKRGPLNLSNLQVYTVWYMNLRP
jgi:hypothetical protein